MFTIYYYICAIIIQNDYVYMEDIMTKKIIAALLAVFALLSFTACASSGSGSVDSQSADAVVNIEEYLPNADEYFSVKDTTVVFDGATDGDLLALYIEKATPKKDLPEELVNSYIESYKSYFGEVSEGDEALRKNAEELIKTEMVIYIAAEKFGVDKITAEEEAAMAKTLADKYGVDESALYTEGGTNYVVKSAVREAHVRKVLEAVAGDTSAE